MTPPSVTRVAQIKHAIAALFDALEVDDAEAASALSSFLMDVFCDARLAHDAQVASEMRRIADCLTILAATPAADMDTLAVAMADTVRSA